MRRATRALLLLAALAMSSAARAEGADYALLSFDDLQGWASDDHHLALEAFLETCGDLKDPAWGPLCAVAKTRPEARSFFELFFRPVLVKDGNAPLFTGYFEPELDGALSPSGRFRYPLYRTPPEARAGPFVSRREIEEGQVLAGRGLEIAWVDDPVELFFLQVQGSGRIRLTNGQVLRVGYGGHNGHSYSSIGQELVRRGVYGAHQVSAQVIRSWVRRNPVAGQELLWTNPSYVFFRKIRNVAAEKGPLGAMNRSITTDRSIAVDPAFTPLGAPVWVEKDGRDPFRRLMVAQDTGSAIKGAQRADIFYGTGDEAGRIAGQIKDPGRMVVLLPIQTAFELVPEGEG